MTIDPERFNTLAVQLTRALAALEQIRTACPAFGNGLPGINEHAAEAYRRCEAIAAKAIAEIEGGEVDAGGTKAVWRFRPIVKNATAQE